MAFKIEIREPVHINGSHYNIPLKQTWNESLLAGLDLISKEIKNANLSEEIHSFSVERNDDFKEFNAAGSIGYSVLTNLDTGKDTSYYIDFICREYDQESNDWVDEPKYYKALSSALTEYIETAVGFNLSSTECATDNDQEGNLVLKLRAYFIHI